MKLCLLFTFLVAAIATDAFATAQVGERLIYRGATNRLTTLPLEPYLKGHKLKLYVISPSKSMSTALWRGYIGTWEIKDGFLYLVRLNHGDGGEVPLSKLFISQERPIKATWYSGTLRATQGKMLQYVHDEFASVFEKDIFIEVDNGKVTSERVVENKLPEPGDTASLPRYLKLERESKNLPPPAGPQHQPPPESIQACRDWDEKFAAMNEQRQSIRIVPQIRGTASDLNQADKYPVSFLLAGQWKLTRIEVFAAQELTTNKNATPLWHMISDSNSVPVKACFYGERIRGMKSAVPQARPLPLQPDTQYTIRLEAGTIKGQTNFHTKALLTPK